MKINQLSNSTYPSFRSNIFVNGKKFIPQTELDKMIFKLTKDDMRKIVNLRKMIADLNLKKQRLDECFKAKYRGINKYYYFAEELEKIDDEIYALQVSIDTIKFDRYKKLYNDMIA